MSNIFLYRIKGDRKQAMGMLVVRDQNGWPIYASVSMERGYMNNAQNISNVPAGTYPIVFEYSDKFDMKLWEIKGVAGRSECKIHAANYWYQLNGCISPGVEPTDLDGDGYLDVTHSADSLKSFHKALEGITETKITIVELDEDNKKHVIEEPKIEGEEIFNQNFAPYWSQLN